MRLSIRFPKSDVVVLLILALRQKIVAISDSFFFLFVVDILLVPYHFTLQAFSVMFILAITGAALLVDPIRI
jgi:hypothetical protein